MVNKSIRKKPKCPQSETTAKQQSIPQTTPRPIFLRLIEFWKQKKLFSKNDKNAQTQNKQTKNFHLP